MADCVSSWRLQEADLQHDGPADQRQIAATLAKPGLGHERSAKKWISRRSTLFRRVDLKPRSGGRYVAAQPIVSARITTHYDRKMSGLAVLPSWCKTANHLLRLQELTDRILKA